MRCSFTILPVCALCTAGGLQVACSGSANGDRLGSVSEGRALIGNVAPDFRLKAIAGSAGIVSLQSLRGKVVLIDFWGTYCAPCKEAFPKLQDLYASHSPKGFRVIGISEDEPEDKGKIASFAADRGAKFTIAWDEDKSIARSYKPETMPSSFLIDKNGVVRFAHVGYRHGEETILEKEIQELLGK
jgi:peroxiredoxin